MMPLPPTERAIAFSMFWAAIVFLLFGAVSTFVWRKPGLTRQAVFWAGSRAAAHPERYVRRDRVWIVRMLSVTGATLFLLAVVALLVMGVLPRT
jgi:hypothetical protein